jgi:hypothetical protein
MAGHDLSSRMPSTIGYGEVSCGMFISGWDAQCDRIVLANCGAQGTHAGLRK